MDIVPTLLRVICETTGLGFAAVGRVAVNTWTAYAVLDTIGLGVKLGSEFDTTAARWMESRTSGAPLLIEHSSVDPLNLCAAPDNTGQIESCISVPIMLDNGVYFGNLCAVDWTPMRVSDPRLLSMFNRFASLIARQIDNLMTRKQEHSALLDELTAGELREQFIAILGHDLRTPLQAIYASGELICAQIVRAHGGKLSVTSTKKDGTQFTARLPLRAHSPVSVVALATTG